MHPHEKFAIQRFEETLTKRGAKKPFFLFTTVSIGETDRAAKSVQSLFLESVRWLSSRTRKKWKWLAQKFKIFLKEYGKMKLLFAPKKLKISLKEYG